MSPLNSFIWLCLGGLLVVHFEPATAQDCPAEGSKDRAETINRKGLDFRSGNTRLYGTQTGFSMPSFSKNFTVCARAKVNCATTAQNTLFSYGEASQPQLLAFRLLAYSGSTSYYYMYLTINGATTGLRISYTQSGPICDVWRSYCVSVNSTSSTSMIDYYVDEVSYGQSRNYRWLNATGNGTLAVGNRLSRLGSTLTFSTNYYFHGIIGTLRLWRGSSKAEYIKSKMMCSSRGDLYNMNVNTMKHGSSLLPTQYKVDTVCEYGVASSTCLYDDIGLSYTGTIATAGENKWSCVDWANQPNYVDSDFPLDGSRANASNYCRNPSRDVRGPWCYTSHETSLGLLTREYCSPTIPGCVNLALGKPTKNIGITTEQYHLTDGSATTYASSLARSNSLDTAWLEVDLQEDKLIELVGIINVPSTESSEIHSNQGHLHVFIRGSDNSYAKCGIVENEELLPGESYYVHCDDNGPIRGRYVHVQQATAQLHLAEIQVFGRLVDQRCPGETSAVTEPTTITPQVNTACLRNIDTTRSLEFLNETGLDFGSLGTANLSGTPKDFTMPALESTTVCVRANLSCNPGMYYQTLFSYGETSQITKLTFLIRMYSNAHFNLYIYINGRIEVSVSFNQLSPQMRPSCGMWHSYCASIQEITASSTRVSAFIDGNMMVKKLSFYKLAIKGGGLIAIGNRPNSVTSTPPSFYTGYYVKGIIGAVAIWGTGSDEHTIRNRYKCSSRGDLYNMDVNNLRSGTADIGPTHKVATQCKRTSGAASSCLFDTYGDTYAGMKSAAGNWECLPWSDQSTFRNRDFPMDGSRANASNYCRNPSGDEGGPWCFTSHAPTYGLRVREYCTEIPRCANRALGKTARNIKYTNQLQNLNDGNPATYATSIERQGTTESSWMEIDLGREQNVELIGIINVPSSAPEEVLGNQGHLHVFVRQENEQFFKCGVVEDEVLNAGASYYIQCDNDGPVRGRYVRVQQDKTNLNLAEIQVFGSLIDPACFGETDSSGTGGETGVGDNGSETSGGESDSDEGTSGNEGNDDGDGNGDSDGGGDGSGDSDGGSDGIGGNGGDGNDDGNTDGNDDGDGNGDANVDGEVNGDGDGDGGDDDGDSNKGSESDLVNGDGGTGEENVGGADGTADKGEQTGVIDTGSGPIYITDGTAQQGGLHGIVSEFLRKRAQSQLKRDGSFGQLAMLSYFSGKSKASNDEP